MPSPERIAKFAAVVTAGSIPSAARSLGVPQGHAQPSHVGARRGARRAAAPSDEPPHGADTRGGAAHRRLSREISQVQIEVRSTTRHVDLIGEGVDVALRIGLVRDPNLIVRKVAAGKCHVMASPADLALHGTPRQARDLQDGVRVSLRSGGTSARGGGGGGLTRSRSRERDPAGAWLEAVNNPPSCKEEPPNG